MYRSLLERDCRRVVDRETAVLKGAFVFNAMRGEVARELS